MNIAETFKIDRSSSDNKGFITLSAEKNKNTEYYPVASESTEKRNYGKDIRQNDSSLQTVDSALADNILNGVSAERGVKAAVMSELAEFDRRMFKTRMENPEYYVYNDILQNSGNTTYRTGRDEGGAYMTADDYIRLCYDVQKSPVMKNFSILNSNREETAEQCRPAHPYRCAKVSAPGKTGFRQSVYSKNTETELTVRRRENRVKLFTEDAGKKYIGREKIVNAGINWRHAPDMLSMAVCVCFLCISITFLAVMGILNRNEDVKITKLENEKDSVSAEVEMLETELEIKNEKAGIEQLARDLYGMTDLYSASFSILDLSPEDVIEKAAQSDNEGGAVPALLNALGLRRNTED